MIIKVKPKKIEDYITEDSIHSLGETHELDDEECIYELYYFTTNIIGKKRLFRTKRKTTKNTKKAWRIKLC